MRNTVTPDRLGTIQGEFVIDPAEAPGVISLVLVNADRTQTSTHQLRVEQYTPKETSVEFTQSPTVPLVGDRISLTARCAHLASQRPDGTSACNQDRQTVVTDPRGEIIIPVIRRNGSAGRPAYCQTVLGRASLHVPSFASRGPALESDSGRSIWLHAKPVVKRDAAPILS